MSIKLSVGSLVTLLVGGWCLFWWGFAAGTHTTYRSELRSLQHRLELWDAIKKASPEARQSPSSIYNLERERLSQLQTMTDVPALYFIFAPIFAPYTAYELHKIRAAEPEPPVIP